MASCVCSMSSFARLILAIEASGSIQERFAFPPGPMVPSSSSSSSSPVIGASRSPPSWPTDRVLRRLEAMLLVGDAESLLVVSGSGEVIEPDDGVAAIGSGGSYALSAARALVRHTSLSAEEVVRESLLVAAEICIYTNDRINVVTLP